MLNWAQYNCTYPDGLTDHGRLLGLYVDAVRYTRNVSFMARHLAAVLRTYKDPCC